MDRLYQDLTPDKSIAESNSVHLGEFPRADSKLVNVVLERRMALAQKITSLSLSLRKKEGVRVRQPLQKIMIPILKKETQDDIVAVAEIIKNELNVKEIEFLTEDSSDVLTNKTISVRRQETEGLFLDVSNIKK